MSKYRVKDLLEEWNSDYQEEIDDIHKNGIQYADLINLHEKSLKDLRSRIDALIKYYKYEV